LAIDAAQTHKADDYRRDLALSSRGPGSRAYHEAVVRGFASRHRWIESEFVTCEWLRVTASAGISESVSRADRAFADIRARQVPAVYDLRPALLDEDAVGTHVDTALDVASTKEALSTLSAV
jgi:hypothetical protein